MSVAESETLPVSVIRQDGGTQARAEIDSATIDSYAESMDNGVAFPAIVAFYDGTDYWLADGFHRLAAIVSRGVKNAAIQVKAGTREDAILYAACANKMHGLRRTNADKRRAVEMLLACEKWAGKSDRWIAEQTGVSPTTVASTRSSTVQIGQLNCRTGQDGKTRRVPESKVSARSEMSEPGNARVLHNDLRDDVEKAWALVSRLNESGMDTIMNRILEIKDMRPE